MLLRDVISGLFNSIEKTKKQILRIFTRSFGSIILFTPFSLISIFLIILFICPIFNNLQQNQHIQEHQQIQNHQNHHNNQHLQQIAPPPAPKTGRGKHSDGKPRGRMTAYAFFVQTCREEHKKKHPEEQVVFAEFSRKCAERWKVCVEHEMFLILVIASIERYFYLDQIS